MLFFCLAGDEGFEPPQTESESGVLPLHKSPVLARRSKRIYYYTQKSHFVKRNFLLFPIPQGAVPLRGGTQA